ncbi:fumarylacetoacetate hydrolase family protein [Pseudorhodoplanes sp.]|uniref:fumarylacetoacetate hydrolase family protein n=1 Tax=Pseudorhodoplanes sp. TaxID=1934341 RepID=UPI00391C630A
MSRHVLVSYAVDSQPRVGVLVNDRVADLAHHTGVPTDHALYELLLDWEAGRVRVSKVAEHAEAGEIDTIPLARVRLLAPLATPATLYCAGANYRDHVLEMAKVAGIEPDPDPRTLGLGSWHFIKSARSVIGPRELIEVPRGAQKLDWEVELAAVIGRKAKRVSAANALDYLAGYTIAVDLSARDFSRRNGISVQSPFRFDWVAHKSFDTGCPLGPWIVPAGFIVDPQRLAISLSINGELKQQSNTSEMIYSVAEQISDLSRNLTLWPGDVILTGTPAGVGSAGGRFLQSGDTIVASIESIGELETVVA